MSSTAGHDKNPYSPDSPEWQLWENMTAQNALALSHHADSERSLARAASAREKAEKFKNALAVLGAASKGGAK